jgi:phospholipid transport system transporter-binding protein
MTVRDQAVHQISGALTHCEAMAERARLLAAISAGCRRIDLGALSSFDSSALAVMLAALRAQAGSGEAIALVAMPDKLRELARLYGLDELLSLAMAEARAVDTAPQPANVSRP